ncbi:MAG: hypothetical protein GY940_16300 [bacterium]|nr:hypothetical protein [bacterium]
MATLSYPGVYMEEVSSGVRPIAAVGTSTAAFVGQTEKGPDDQARRITNWTEFQKHYGTFYTDSFLPQSVFHFFNNGGSQCYIARVTRSGAAVANVTVHNRAAANGIVFSATSKGGWGNYLYLKIEDGTNDPGNTFKLSIRKQDVKDVVPSNFSNTVPMEVHDNLNMDPDSPSYVVTALKNRSNLIEATMDVANTVVQSGFHKGGFSPPATFDEAITGPQFQINIDNDGFQTVVLDDITAGTLLSVVKDDITAKVSGLSKLKASTDQTAFDDFLCAVINDPVKGDYFVLTSGKDSETSSVRVQPSSAADISGLLKLGDAYGGVSEDGLALRRPANIDVVQVGDANVNAPIAAVTAGSDGSGDLDELSYSTVFTLFDKITDFSLLAVPGIGTPTMMDLGMAYCSNRALQDVFYIGDMAADEDAPEDAEVFRKLLTTPNSYGAVYFPWVKALDATGKSQEPVLLPPSGYIAGLYARIDSQRGVWKAPAGIEATINGTVGLAADLTDVEQGNLNLRNINCIRRFPGAGIVNWGARTVTSDPEWTYVPVRRMAIMLRISIYNGIQWAVFEPNDEDLWGQLRLNLNSFMMTLFRKGAFQGSSPSDAFFVKCDSETTTQDDINLGIVNVQVGFAPLKPAEFVVVSISQKAGQAS